MSIESPFDCLEYFLLPGKAAVFRLETHIRHKGVLQGFSVERSKYKE